MDKKQLTAELQLVLDNPNYKIEELNKLIFKHQTYKTDLCFETICRAAAVACDIGVYVKMLGRTRDRSVVRARYFVFAYYRRNTDLSLQKIGELFSRDHATVLHGLKVLKNDIKTNFKTTVEEWDTFNNLINTK